ncbi:MAG: glycoside hydrolase family 88 protein [Promethearchaeota archaeon]
MENSNIMDKITQKLKKHLKIENFPHVTKNGKWQTTRDGYWSGGFWIGILWWMHVHTGDDLFKNEAIKWLKRLEKRKTSRTFDLGFIFYPSFILGYKITKDEQLKKVALEAADTLLTTFNPHLNVIYDEMVQENQKVGKVLIDIMPNLKLLWWAFKETGNTKYYDIANLHAQRTIKELIRSDGSTYQGFIFDLKSNAIIKKVTFQGINTESCWSRGQAWAILGFAMASEYTKNEEYLSVTKKLARYYLKHLPLDNKVPYYDFDVKPNPNEIRDTSAAAIASAGLLNVYRITKEEYYKEQAHEIIQSLYMNYFNDEMKDGFLSDGCFYLQKDWGVKESMIWGDYFFIESLIQLIYSNQKSIKNLF